MNGSKKFKKASEFVDRLTDFLAYPDEEEEKEILKQRLIERGLDPDGTLKRVKAFIEKKRSEKRLSWKEIAQKKQEGMKEQFEKVLQKVTGTPEELKNRVQEIINRKTTLLYARNLDDSEMTDEEMKILIATFELEIQDQSEDSDEKRNLNGYLE